MKKLVGADTTVILGGNPFPRLRFGRPFGDHACDFGEAPPYPFVVRFTLKNGIEYFYRYAGPNDLPTVESWKALVRHVYPASGFPLAGGYLFNQVIRPRLEFKSAV